MWALLSLYWASLAYTAEPGHTRNLRVWVVNRDGASETGGGGGNGGDGMVGAILIDAVQSAIERSEKDGISTLGWEVIDGSGMSDEDVVKGVLEEKVWGAIIGTSSLFFLPPLPRQSLIYSYSNSQ